MNLYQETKFIMNKYGISANKSLGQNFLIDEEVVNSIVTSANITNEDLVIEIGPGLGTLTAKLLEKAKKVICVELDTRMIKILKERFLVYSNLEIINEDILKVNLTEIIQREKTENNIKNVKIVANLPYYITTPIIMKLLEDNLDIESITVMIQKEVADRLCANPSSKLSGAITYTVYYYSEAEKIIEVPNNSFIPEPEVTSEVIKLVKRKEAPVEVNNPDFMFKIIKASFMQRRKTLANGLINGNILKTKQEIYEMLDSLNIPQNVRGEALTLEQFAEIANYLICHIGDRSQSANLAE